MNNSSCDGYSETGVIALASTCALSFLVCLVTVVLVFVLRLYKLVVYRLALYQVLAALVNSGQYVFNIINVNYSDSPSEVYVNLCTTLAYVSLLSAWAKLLLTFFVSVHLFCFAVYHKNLKRLEPLYVVVSLTVPSVIAAIPAITHSYGLAGSWCWIVSWYDNCPSHLFTTAIIEEFTLWYGPSMFTLALASIAMIVMVIVLICRIHRFGYDQNWNALKQLLPLCVYPLAYFSLHVPPFVYRVITASRRPTSGQIVMAAVCFSGWSLLAGVSLMVHISVATLCSKKGGATYKVAIESDDIAKQFTLTMTPAATPVAASTTRDADSPWERLGLCYTVSWPHRLLFTPPVLKREPNVVLKFYSCPLIFMSDE